MALSDYICLANALHKLMHPLIEVVIHDLQAGSICYIIGELSKRSVGDISLLEIDNCSKQDINTIVYPKINFDGRLIKSISVPIEDKWLLCINVDISIFSQMKNLSECFFGVSSQTQPGMLFRNDWQEQLHIAIHDYLQMQKLSFEHLSSMNKKNLVRHLYTVGAFKEKNAADYIAKILKLGRATVFNYIKEWKNQ